MASTSAAEVREALDVSSTELPDAEIQEEIAAAESFVEERLDGHMADGVVKDQIATLVAADILYPRVTGGAKGQEKSSVEEGSARVSFATTSAADAVGDSPHWQQAIKLDHTGRLEGNSASFEVY